MSPSIFHKKRCDPYAEKEITIKLPGAVVIMINVIARHRCETPAAAVKHAILCLFARVCREHIGM
jgi:hypothetical protein